MKDSSFYQLLKNLTGNVYLFESDSESDDFLKKAIHQLMEKAGSTLGAAYLFNPLKKELEFRVGYDKNDFWDSLRCGGKKAPRSFSLDGNEVGRAFTEGTIKVIKSSQEEKQLFGAKIIIPILRGPEKIGVLLIAHEDRDFFDGIDKADLMSAVSLLGDVLVEANALLEHWRNRQKVRSGSFPDKIRGKKASGGIISGTALPIWGDMEAAVHTLPPKGNPEEEKALFQRALKDAQQQLEEFQNSSALGPESIVSLIFTAQIYMLKDQSFTNKILSEIESGNSAAAAVKTVVNQYAELFSGMDEIRMAEKAQDVRDLGYRLITNMGRSTGRDFSYKGRIVLSRHIYPSDLYRLAVEGVSGLVLKGTGVTAHISILARSLKLPVLITDDRAFLQVPAGTPLILDADKGILHIDPSEEDFARLNKAREMASGPVSYTIKGQSAEGVPVSVLANINIYKDAQEAVTQGAEGIGLYRSEFPFIVKNDFLSEEQQYRIYRSIVNTQRNKPVVLRTADIGGDKLLKGRNTEESNPFLGVRGIRFSLANREMFREQLKAMLRAGYESDLHILLPMVTDVDEVLQAREEIEFCSRQLERRGDPYNINPKIGAMIELPSAAISVKEIAIETDFLSIGTNDLTMYLLAVDRTNENLSHLYSTHHPTVLKMLSHIAQDAGSKKDRISVCGDAASDPLMIPFFMGLGIRKLSVSPELIEPVKQQIKGYTIEEAETICQEMLQIRRLPQMESYIESFLKKKESLFY